MRTESVDSVECGIPAEEQSVFMPEGIGCRVGEFKDERGVVEFPFDEDSGKIVPCSRMELLLQTAISCFPQAATGYPGTLPAGSGIPGWPW